MNNTENIGRKVWLLEDKGAYCICKKDKTYLVVAIVEPKHNLPDGSVNTDWCDHFILQREDGTLFHEREYQCVVTPDESIKDISSRFYDCLRHNHLYPDEVYPNDDAENPESIIVHIDWGDWKHDHGWCDVLMGYLGYTCGDEQVTDENGSDCYSSTHYYYKVA